MDNHKKTIGLESRSLFMAIKRYIDAGCSDLSDDRLTGIQGMVLGYISRHSDSEIYQRDLEKRFDFKRSTATKLLQLLEKLGYIRRESVMSDARLKRIVLTDKGVELHKQITRRIDKSESEIDALLTSDERKTFFELCNKIKSGLAADGGNND